MMLRRVDITDSFEFPYTVIETQEDTAIIDVPLTYSVQEKIGEEEIEIEIADEEGVVTIETQIVDVYETVTYEVDVESIGIESSWYEVNGLQWFDYQIGDVIYSFADIVKIGKDRNDKLGRVIYKTTIGRTDDGDGNIVEQVRKVKKLSVPYTEPLAIKDNKIVVVSKDDFYNVVYRDSLDDTFPIVGDVTELRLRDIALYKNGNYIKQYGDRYVYTIEDDETWVE